MSERPLQQIDVGDMRQRIRIQQNVGAPSPAGAIAEDWQDFARVWAAITPLGGNELFQVQQIYPESNTTIKIRYLAGIDPTMRVLWLDPRTKQDVQFDIINITDTELRHYELVLTCKQRPIERNA